MTTWTVGGVTLDAEWGRRIDAILRITDPVTVIFRDYVEHGTVLSDARNEGQRLIIAPPSLRAAIESVDQSQLSRNLRIEPEGEVWSDPRDAGHVRSGNDNG